MTAFNGDYRNCFAGVYHLFTVLSGPDKDGSKVQSERCKYCGKVEDYTFEPDGRMTDSRKYFLDHIRAFAQPIEDDPGMMAAFLHCNPNAAARLAKEKADKDKSETFQNEMTEKFHWAMKRALDNQGWKDGSRSSDEK